MQEGEKTASEAAPRRTIAKRVFGIALGLSLLGNIVITIGLTPLRGMEQFTTGVALLVVSIGTAIGLWLNDRDIMQPADR